LTNISIMIYNAIGLMSGSSLDGIDIVFAEFVENGGIWSYKIINADCLPYSLEWGKKLQTAISLNSYEYQLLHTEYGHFLGQQLNQFIDKYGLQYKVNIIVSHGHTTFHDPLHKMTAQLGDGASIAAETGLPVVSDLRALDVAFGGQGAPIVPIGEKHLFSEYSFFLNVGGIANVSIADNNVYTAFDISPANRVLNMLANDVGKEYDAGGAMAASGKIIGHLLKQLDELDYYKQPPPKSLANSFGVEVVYPMLVQSKESITDLLRTYTEHIAIQIKKSVSKYKVLGEKKMLITGGGAFNSFLIERIRTLLQEVGIEVVVPGNDLVNYKEALIMAFIGVLRQREQYNILSTVTGATRSSIGGALWLGQEE
jgi:anhydro-N-acetylmuramic acid kinase